MTPTDLIGYLACIVLIPPTVAWAVLYVAGGTERDTGNAMAIELLLAVYGLASPRHARLLSRRSERRWLAKEMLP